MKHHWLTFLFMLLLTLGSASPAMGWQSNSEQAVVSKAEAAARARSAVNGRVLRVEQTRTSYRVKVLKKSGRVVSVDVDKRSGQVKPSKRRNAER